MNKKQFLLELKKGLKKLPKEEMDDIIDDYETHFKEAMKKKRKEDAVAKALGNPKTIAKQLVADFHVKAAKKEASAGNVMRAIFASIGLGFFNLIIVIGPVIGLLGALVGLYAGAIAVAASALAAVAAGIVIIVWGDVLFGLGALFGGISLAALGILWFIGCNYVAKFFFKGLAAYMGLNVRIIRGEKK